MVKFEFILSDEQAELLISILQEHVLYTRENTILSDLAGGKEWVEKHTKLIEEMTTYISKNSRRLDA